MATISARPPAGPAAGPLLAALAALAAAATGSCTGETPRVVQPVPPPTYAWLSPVEHLVRASMALRGVRPSPEDVLAVEADPGALRGVVEEYLASPEFGATIKDMHAELYLVRADTNDPFPALGPMASYTMQELYAATSEEPLELVRHVVEADLPYTAIVTADYVVANRVLAEIYGLPYDDAGPEWQPTHYVDGRAHAGVLSTSEPYRRHVSNGSNFHRGRANFWASTLLCESFATRDVVVEGGVDLSDEAAVAHAVITNPTCIGCHQALDPMADLFWGFRRQLTGRNIKIGETSDCRAPVADEMNEPEQDYTFITDLCFPLRFYSPANEGLWADVGLRPPSYYGEPVDDLADLGAAIARDPRFSQCSARQLYRWFAQVGLDEVGLEQSSRLQAMFEHDGMVVRRYLEDVVLSDAFRARERLPQGEMLGLDPAIPVQVVRPEQYARLIEALTGFRWLAMADKPLCLEEGVCWGEIDLATSDVFGYRAMSGGIDGLTVTQPTHTVTPVKLLVASRFATEAAAFAVRADLALPAAERRLLRALPDVDPASATDDATVRAELAELSLAVLSERLAPDDPALDPWHTLFFDTFEGHGNDATAAWIVTVAAMLRDPALLYY
jgi:hypothetical protein